MRLRALIFAVSISASRLVAQSTGPVKQTPPSTPTIQDLAPIAATRTDKPVLVDGRNDDDVWKKAPINSNFRQFDPVENGEPRFKTEFQVAYDSHTFYVYVRAYDAQPNLIRKVLARRDVRPSSDQIKIVIDSYHDRRTGYEFAVSPGRVKRDYAIYDDGNEDQSWDGVWDVATTVDSLGWTAEFAIPLSQMRFTGGEKHEVGFGVWRDIDRFKERVSWPLYRQTVRGFPSQLGVVSGIDEIDTAHPLEVTPYAVTKNLSTTAGTGFGRSQHATVGGDLKYGLTPSLRLNATINPDFGQVEADPAVLNLSAFETFFTEQRPFFVEGSGRYNFSINCNTVNCSNEGLFYSRRIGRTPQLGGVYSTPGAPTATTILGAAKLSGRLGQNVSIATLDAVTQRAVGANDHTIEPTTNYSVLRLQRDMRAGASSIGLVATNVDRAQDASTEQYLRTTATVAGLDFRHRFLSNTYEVSGSATGTDVTGSEQAIARTQRSAVHYYQRPDSHLPYDTTRTSLTGDAEELLFGKVAGQHSRFQTSYQRQSAGYEINDLGYLRRADEQSWSTWGDLEFRTPNKLFKSFYVNGNQWNRWTTNGLALEHAVNTNMHMTLRQSNYGLNAGSTLSQLGSTYCDRCARGGPAIRNSPYGNVWFNLNGDDRQRFIPYLYFGGGRGDGGRSHDWDVRPELDMRITSQLSGSINADISGNTNDKQWIGNFPDSVGGTHYAFARLRQNTIASSIRATYIATPELSVQFYAQPFISTGSYAHAAELSATPRSSNYDARFKPYAASASALSGFRDTEFRSNTVVRWEYRPGSTLFFVWTQGRQRYDDSYNPRTENMSYKDLLAIRPDNTFLIKLTYWLNR